MNQTICLNLVVVDDNPMVLSVLKQVKLHLDYWVIAEVGCSESCLEGIERLMADIPGEIVSVEDSSQAACRNTILEYSRDKADYLLLLEGDIGLHLDDETALNNLQADAYFVFSDGITREATIRLIRNQLVCQYVGVVREYLITQEGASIATLQGAITRTYTSANAQKANASRDSIVLQDILNQNAEDSHALFHLAKIKLSESKHHDAYKLFQKLVEVPGQLDPEWRWYAFFSIARLAEVMEYDSQLVVDAYLKAHQCRPVRAEALYELARYHRQKTEYSLAQIYSAQAFNTPLPESDTYDLNTRTYSWHIPAEHALICQQLGRHEEVVKAANRALLDIRVPRNMSDSLIASRQRSVDIVDKIKRAQVEPANENGWAVNKIRLLIPFRNAAQYLQRCIKSIETQDYENFTATFIDDCSTDGSAQLIPSNNNKFEVVQNDQRKGALRNRMDFILSCDQDDIVLYLDGDDQLASDNTLSYINELYNQHDCWLSYGQYISQNAHLGHAIPYASQSQLWSSLDTGQMRFPIHPITHRAGLFQRILDFDPELNCFKDDDGEWLFYASDAVLARPLFCLAGFSRIHYCNRALYLYTEGHDTSVFTTNNKEQIETCRIITKRPRLPIIQDYRQDLGNGA
jgi:glycosyltransferase involved in cell wall biosynthesis